MKYSILRGYETHVNVDDIHQDMDIVDTSPQSGSSHNTIAWPYYIGQHMYSTDST